jgi:flagellar hook-associated protein 3 FlgL
VISSTRYRATAEIARQNQVAQQIAKLQESVSTDKRLSAPSDDPTAANRISEIRQAQADQAVWGANIKSGQASSETADSTLGSIQTLLNRAKELMLSARNDSTSDIDRQSIANEMRGLVTDLNTYSQTVDQTGRSLFPTGAVLVIPVSEGLNLPASVTRAEVFDQVTTASGTKTIASILTDAADSLGLTNVAQRDAGVDASLAAIDSAGAHVTQVRADQGVRGQRFDDAAERLQASSDSLTAERTGLENTDLPYALSTYQAKQVSLQAAQTVFAQSHKSSLFDMLG